MLSWNWSKHDFRPWFCQAANIDDACLGAERCEWRLTDKGFGCDRQRIWLEEYDEDVVRNRVGHCLVPLCQLEQLPCTPTDEGAYTLDSSVEANVIRSLDVSMLLWTETWISFGWVGSEWLWLTGLDVSAADVACCLAWSLISYVQCWFSQELIIASAVDIAVLASGVCRPQTNVFPVNGIHVLASRCVYFEGLSCS